ncbi:MAG: flagellar motor switch phosphatase FliY [Lachnospiraceae bacterium]|nr:flagellar motor switch phosphatase FliY [Lachnospiraceae bacterium]
MDGVLSQEEINALLNDPGTLSDSPSGGDGPKGDAPPLTDKEKDAIGEIANISMGTAATTLFSLVNQRVEISTPVVTFATWDDIVEDYPRPCVFIRIGYTVGLDGSNLLVIKEQDVKVITDLMMGGDGTNTDGELSELHLSAICEAMNQMMGSAATSLSSMLNKVIDISPPKADLIDLTDNVNEQEIDEFLKSQFVKITFKMEIGDLVDSEIMQLYPFSFAREMYESVSKNMEVEGNAAAASAAEPAPAPAPAAAPPPQAAAAPPPQAAAAPPGYGMPMMTQPMMDPVNVQPAQFAAFSPTAIPANLPENIDLILDVPLDVTVELGRTSKSIQEILDFAPGTILELNKIAGEPIDILVNGKYVAKGEVVVIEESFGVRITDIIQ